MIGDQFLTDIYGSNKLGLTSCLIDKISDVEGKYTKFKRNQDGAAFILYERGAVLNKETG